MAIDKLGVSEQVQFRLNRGDGRMETKEITIEGKSFTLQRVGNLTMMGYMGAGDVTSVISKLIQNTVKNPTLTIEDIETLETTVFAKLLEEVMLINKYADFVASMNVLSNSLSITNGQSRKLDTANKAYIG